MHKVDNQRQRKPNEQSRMNNPETRAKWVQDSERRETKQKKNAKTKN